MGLVQDIQDDAADITGDPEEAVFMKLTAPTGEIANIYGLHTKHYLKLDQNSNSVSNMKTASAVVHPKNILATNSSYPIRINDSSSEHNQDVMMIGHLVDAPDASGIVKNYIVLEQDPDEFTGLIKLDLGDYRP